MTYIKLIFFLILVMMDRCGIITPISRRDIISVETDEPAEYNLNGTWRLTDAGNPDSVQNESKNVVKEDLLLSFFPDSTFTEIKVNGEYQTGNYAYSESDHSLSLKFESHSEKVKVLFDLAANGSRMVILHFAPEKSISLIGSGKSLEKYKEDPFYFANNSWRIKPSKSENRDQILNRLMGYLAHNAFILKTADTRNQEIVSWEFSKGIVKIYNGGVGIISKDQIPQIWINSFHSREDALKAYEMFENYLRTTSYKGTATGNWVKDDYKILMSIYEGLKRTT
jgi:hypothetical protein